MTKVAIPPWRSLQEYWQNKWSACDAVLLYSCTLLSLFHHESRCYPRSSSDAGIKLFYNILFPRVHLGATHTHSTSSSITPEIAHLPHPWLPILTLKSQARMSIWMLWRGLCSPACLCLNHLSFRSCELHKNRACRVVAVRRVREEESSLNITSVVTLRVPRTCPVCLRAPDRLPVFVCGSQAKIGKAASRRGAEMWMISFQIKGELKCHTSGRNMKGNQFNFSLVFNLNSYYWALHV